MSREHHTYSFEELTVWKEARKLAHQVYEKSAKFPKDEIFGLTSQMRRCSISIASNIAEGSAKSTKKDQGRYYDIAFGSAMELLNQLILANDFGYISTEELKTLRSAINSVTYLLYKLKNSLGSSDILREPPPYDSSYNSCE